jgi:D-alanyl-D-alanine dipeptidase
MRELFIQEKNGMNNSTELVRLLDVDDEFIIDLKYATTDNFTKKNIYQINECFINPGTAQILIEAKNIFKSEGYGVKVWDAFRPIWAHKMLWDIVSDDDFVAVPPSEDDMKNCKPSHFNGMSVDVTLVDHNGNELPMPTPFDYFGEEAAFSSLIRDSEAKTNAKLLIDVMGSVGFDNYEKEWWHFDDRIHTPTLYMDYKLDDLLNKNQGTVPK